MHVQFGLQSLLALTALAAVRLTVAVNYPLRGLDFLVVIMPWFLQLGLLWLPEAAGGIERDQFELLPQLFGSGRHSGRLQKNHFAGQAYRPEE